MVSISSRSTDEHWGQRTPDKSCRATHHICAPEQIDLLVAVLALEMILADLHDYMLLVTMSAAKHSATICAKLSTVRHTFLVGTMTLRTHAGTIMIFSVVIALLTNLAVVAEAEISRHCRDEVVVILAQKDVDFLHSF